MPDPRCADSYLPHRSQTRRSGCAALRRCNAQCGGAGPSGCVAAGRARCRICAARMQGVPRTGGGLGRAVAYGRSAGPRWQTLRTATAHRRRRWTYRLRCRRARPMADPRCADAGRAAHWGRAGRARCRMRAARIQTSTHHRRQLEEPARNRSQPAPPYASQRRPRADSFASPRALDRPPASPALRGRQAPQRNSNAAKVSRGSRGLGV